MVAAEAEVARLAKGAPSFHWVCAQRGASWGRSQALGLQQGRGGWGVAGAGGGAGAKARGAAIDTPQQCRNQTLSSQQNPHLASRPLNTGPPT